MEIKKSIQLVRDLDLKKPCAPCVATIGNFDGLHRGHRKIIDRVVALAKQQGLPSTVITFEPAPLSFLRPDLNILRLTPLVEKIRILKSWGIDNVVCLRFNESLAHYSAEDFIQSILCDALQLKGLVIGEDFRFGYKQTGTIALLKTLGLQCGFKTEAVSLLEEDGARISSTAIREALLAGNLKQVRLQLGRHYSVTKRVIRGKQRGQQWGIPTANVPLHNKRMLFQGVYITRVWVGNDRYWAATNVGTRPSVDGKHYVIESHLLNFKDNLYGKRITVEFIHKLRDEKRFENSDALLEQIRLDIQTVKEWAHHHSRQTALT